MSIQVEPRGSWINGILGPLRVVNFFLRSRGSPASFLPHLRKWTLALRPICAVGGEYASDFLEPGVYIDSHRGLD